MKRSNLCTTALALLPLTTPSAQGPCAEEAMIQVLGAGTHGTLGIPGLGFVGAPLVRGPFRFAVTSARPEALGFFGYSPNESPLILPPYGATLYPGLPLFVVPFPVDRSGSSPPLMPTAAVPPLLCGHDFAAQAAVLDPQAQGGLAFTRAYRLRFGVPVDGPLFPAAKYPVGEESWDVASGDLDGDGVIDLAVANKGSDDVSVLLGRGDGTFGATLSVAAGDEPRSIALGDLDLDGVLDLVTANEAPGDVSVLLGNGDGTLAPAQSFSAGPGPSDVAIGHLDADGVPDLAVASRMPWPTNENVALLRGLGGGAFASPQFPYFGQFASTVAIEDLDGDGAADLAVTNPGFGDDWDGSVGVRMNNGDGTFAPTVYYLVGEHQSSIQVEDLDGDSVPDLAALGGGHVKVLLGVGDGTFGAVQASFAAEGHMFDNSLKLDDVDGDGQPDALVVAWGHGTDGELLVLLGHGDGTFAAPLTSSPGKYPTALTISDFDGDAAADVAVSLKSSDHPVEEVLVLLGGGDGVFGPPPMLDDPFIDSVALGDLDGDQVIDLVGAFKVGLHVKEVQVHLGVGDGTFAQVQTLAAGEYPYLAIGDLDADGDPDLAVASYGSDVVLVFSGLGDGTFGPSQSLTAGTGPRAVAIADFDADGALDLAVANTGSDDVSVFRGLGSGTFGSAQAFAVGERPDSVASADLDADGDLDLAVTCGGQHLLPASTPGSVDVLPGVGDGSFGPAQSYFAGEHPGSVAIADLDVDGALDLAVRCAGSYAIPASVGVLLGAGDGTFEAVQSMEALGATGSIAIGDVDGDLLLDLAASQPWLRAASVFLGRGDGTFEPALSFLAGGGLPIAIADIDGRGLDDLVVGWWVLPNLRVH